MPRAKKASPEVADAAPATNVENPKTARRKGKRPAEDQPEEPTVPTKARKTVLAKSKQPEVVKDDSSEAYEKMEVDTSPPPKRKIAKPKSKAAASAAAPAPQFVSDLTHVVPATVYTFGNNDCGQLGLNDMNIEKRRYPALVPNLREKKFIQVACGGMHTLALESVGTVWSFGLNDDKALGRPTEEEEDAFAPGEVNVPGKVVQISAGDSHSAALTDDGIVYAWGCFKDDNGNYGLIADEGEICRVDPQPITKDLGVKIKKIVSGSHHIVMLGEDGLIYTCGTGSQGQLGRAEPDAQPKRVTRSMATGAAQGPESKKVHLLKPAVVKIGRGTKFSNIWAGEFSTYCQTNKGKDIYVFGLNNHGQLGIKVKDQAEKNVMYKPTKTTSFKGKMWKIIAPGIHHAVALDDEGKVYTIGRNTEGRLGLGPGSSESYDSPQLVKGLEDKKCIYVSSGTSTSYAITSEGHLYSWGFGENFQLAAGDDEDRDVPTRCNGRKDSFIEGKVVCVHAGGQHVALTIDTPAVMNGN